MPAPHPNQTPSTTYLEFKRPLPVDLGAVAFELLGTALLPEVVFEAPSLPLSAPPSLLRRSELDGPLDCTQWTRNTR